MDNCNGGRFRKKNNGYSVISNEILRDNRISLKAKGLYSLIQSYLSLENFTLYKGYLKSLCLEGDRAFDSAWKELKDSGYLIQYKLREGSTHFYYEYELLDYPTESVNDSSKTDNQCNDSLGIQNVPVHLEPVQPEVVQNWGNILNTDKSNYLSSNYLQSNINTITNTSTDAAEQKDTLKPSYAIDEENPYDLDLVKAAVLKNIDYESYTGSDVGMVDNIIRLILDVFLMKNDTFLTINRQKIPVNCVKSRFLSLNSTHIRYILMYIRSYNGKISNTRNFLITMLYNAPATGDIYLTNLVNHNLYGG